MSAPTPGLRERKKARTRWAIQEHALRLFADQGYDATTVDQIAAAAEISPSTFFRYFRTKEDVVVQDEFDDLLLAAFREAGRSENPVRALHQAIVDGLSGVDAAELAKSQQRMGLVFAVPALRARAIENALAGLDDAARVFAEGVQRDPDDPAVRAFVGAVIGAFVPLLFRWARDGYPGDTTDLLDRTLSGLEEVLTWR